MPNAELSKEEAKIVSVLRAINRYDKPHLVRTDDVGEVYSALTALVDLDQKEKDLSGEQLSILLDGFVAGYAQQRHAEMVAYIAEMRNEYGGADIGSFTEEELGETVSGGNTGGVVAGQSAKDPRYIHQTGPQPGQEKVD